MSEFFVIIQGILKFWDEVVSLVKFLRGTPSDRIAKTKNALKSAFEKAEKTGDTSDIEDVIRG